MKKIIRIFLPFLILTILSGCWDTRELEKLLLVRGVGIDENDDKQIQLMYQILLPQSSDAQSGQVPTYKNIKTKGKTVLEAVYNVSLKDNPIYSEHLKILLMGEKIASKKDILEVLNYFIRDDEVRTSTYLLVAKGSAQKLLTIQKQKKAPVEKLYDISENVSYSGKIVQPLRLGRASGYLRSNQSFLIQAVSRHGNELVYDGAGIIKSKYHKLIGFISPSDVRFLNWLTGQINGGVLPLIEKGKPITYEISKVESNIKPILKDGKLSFNIHITSNGQLAEDWYEHGEENAFNKNYLRKLERIFEKKIEGNIKQALKTLQNDYKVDPIGLGDYVRIQYPRYWKKVKSNWDEIFSEVAINYDVRIHIKKVGT